MAEESNLSIEKDLVNTPKGNSITIGDVQMDIVDNVAFVRLGYPYETLWLFNSDRVDAISQIVDQIKRNCSLNGAVFLGLHRGMFCAGVDFGFLREINTSEAVEKFCAKGQQLMSKIASLSCPTVAAISGLCLGGGCELALACDYRILDDYEYTQIGFPEIKLGIIPGFGGTQRFPRVVGLPNALRVMLKGRILTAQEAHGIGFADVLVKTRKDRVDGESVLESTARKIIADSKITSNISRNISRNISFKDRLLTFMELGRSYIVSKVRQQMCNETSDNLSVAEAVIDVCMVGLREGMERGCLAEAKTVGRLVFSPHGEALLRVHFLTEAASNLGKAAYEDLQGRKIGIVGGGVTGASIAAICAAAGLRVSLVDTDSKVCEQLPSQIADYLKNRNGLTDAECHDRLVGVQIGSSYDLLEQSVLVVETVPDEFDIKRDALCKIAEHVAKDTIIATNTSSLPVSILAESVENSNRIIGLHFLNPVERAPLVEVVFGLESDNRCISFGSAFANMLGKYPVITRDAPGFLVNRILSSYLQEACSLLTDGISADVVETQATCFGMPMGPLRFLDEVGLEFVIKVGCVMQESYGPRFRVSTFIDSMVEQGKCGKSCGRGFYVYKDGHVKLDSAIEDIVKTANEKNVISDQDVIDRLIFSMANEAIRCLDDHVAGEAGKESAGQIDLSSVMGVGFPPFRGGIIHYIDTLGAEFVVKRLSELMDLYGERFSPAKGVKLRAEQGKSFYEAC